MEPFNIYTIYLLTVGIGIVLEYVDTILKIYKIFIRFIFTRESLTFDFINKTSIQV